MDIERIWSNWKDSKKFSGVFSVSSEQRVLFERCCGYRNRSERLPNNRNTAFGIASGTKLFTGLTICKLIDEGKLSLNDKLWNILPYDLGQIDKRVTVYHLLTHTSGIGDYIDEENPDSYEQEQELCNKYPVYLWDNLKYYLQMITPLPQKFVPGTRFSYSNSGFIMLGLVIESITKLSYQQFVTDKIVLPLKLKHTGFYRMDALPTNTALGYMCDSTSGLFGTNIYRLPILGGSDGGIYTCAQDLEVLWHSVLTGCMLSHTMLQLFLKSHIQRTESKSYGLGVYSFTRNKQVAYYAVGSDFGVDFFTVYFPKQKITASALGNTEINTHELLEALFQNFLQ